MASKPLLGNRRPVHADEIREGDPYELSGGTVLECFPTGGRGSRASQVGSLALGTDPDVEEVGLDTGFSPDPLTLRAPDLAVGNVPNEPGWVAGVPPLAVEYADRGQDEAALARKIRELLAAGTRHLWVVRLEGPRRVEVHEPGREMRLARPGERLTAPGILRNPVPVEALYDRDAGLDVTFRNLLQRHGYDSLEAVRDEAKGEGRVEGAAEGELRGLRESILEVLASRGLAMTEAVQAAIASCRDPGVLKAWLRRAVTASSADALLERSPGA